MTFLKIILAITSAKFLTFYHLVGIVLIFSQVNISRSKDSASFDNSINNYDYISDVIRRYKRQNLNSGVNCELPSNPLYGRYSILGDSVTSYKPGDFVHEFRVLEICCYWGYAINPFERNISICINASWNQLPTACFQLCPSLNSTASTSVTCKYRDIPLNSCHDPIEEATALLLCNPLYEEDSLQKNIIRTCTAGRWIPAISECHPMCGVKRPKGRPNIINGQDATMGDYPWQVGIYDHQKKFLCGGSILDRHIILTAAHCFTNYDGQVKPVENYYIAAGKYYREYDNSRDEYAQYSKVLQVHVTERYRGIITSQAHDIAIILLTDSFTISEVVQPICIELYKESPSMHLSLNSSGIVTGWGYTQEGAELSDVLKELVVPIIPFDKCFEEITQSFRKYLTGDKICAGYLNNGTAICNGDTGGALVFKNLLDERYYIEGIPSMSPPTQNFTCDSNQYSLYTSIKEHIDFIKNLLAQHQIPQSIQLVADESTSNEDVNEK